MLYLKVNIEIGEYMSIIKNWISATKKFLQHTSIEYRFITDQYDLHQNIRMIMENDTFYCGNNIIDYALIIPNLKTEFM